MIKKVLTSVWKKNIWALASVGMLVAFSCQDDMLAERQQVVKGDEIAFLVANDSVQSVKSRSEKKISRQFITMIGKDSVFLQVVEENNHDLSFTSKADDSRSASFNQDNLASFQLFAYLNDETEFMVNQSVVKSVTQNDELKWSYSPIKYWPNNKNDFISFYGYALKNDKGNISNFSINKEERKGSFNYALPVANVDKKDAENQPDMIFAITPEQKKGNGGEVNLSFCHALSAILFKMGDMPEGVKVIDISLKSVSTSGECVYGIGEDGMEFTWTEQNTDGNYTQVFNKTKTSVGEEPELISVDEKLFMMIPQDLTEASLEISFQVGEKIQILSSPLNLDGFPSSWNPDAKYTYIISTTGMVDVEIQDECTATVKSKVKIQNTGFSKAYIRATVVGYWVNEAGIVVQPWSFEDSSKGEIDWNYDETPYWEPVTGASVWGDYWDYDETDGFYYYKHELSPTKYAYPLFDKYNLKEKAPFSGAELIVNVVVQAVDDKSKW